MSNFFYKSSYITFSYKANCTNYHTKKTKLFCVNNIKAFISFRSACGNVDIEQKKGYLIKRIQSSKLHNIFGRIRV